MSNTFPDPSKEFAGRRAPDPQAVRAASALPLRSACMTAAQPLPSTARLASRADPRKGAAFIAGDLRTEEGVKGIATEALGVLGDIDILVNNAGSGRRPFTRDNGHFG